MGRTKLTSSPGKGGERGGIRETNRLIQTIGRKLGFSKCCCKETAPSSGGYRSTKLRRQFN